MSFSKQPQSTVCSEARGERSCIVARDAVKGSLDTVSHLHRRTTRCEAHSTLALLCCPSKVSRSKHVVANDRDR